MQEFFLNDRRRKKLVSDLADLSMPMQTAIFWAWMRPNIDLVDTNLATIIRLLGYHIHMLSETTGREAREAETFLAADTLIVTALLDEIAERELPRCRFVRTNLAMEETLPVVDQRKLDLLKGWQVGRLQ